MKYAVILSASNTTAGVELDWAADTLTVTNSTTATLYVRVGGRDTPSETNYDHLVPPGVSRSIPVAGGTFALALVGGVGGIGAARCDCLFLRDEASPSMAGYELPPATVVTDFGPIASGAYAEVIIDARGFAGLFTAIADGAPNLGVRYYLGATASGPWRWYRSARTFTTQVSLIRSLPVGAGFVKLQAWNKGASPLASLGLTYRGIRQPPPSDAPRLYASTVTADLGSIANGASKILASYPEWAGIVRGVAVSLTGLDPAQAPAVVVQVETDPGGLSPARFTLGQVAPAAASSNRVHLAGADPYLVDGDSTSRHYWLPLGLPSAFGLGVVVYNVSASGYTLPSVQASMQIDTEG